MSLAAYASETNEKARSTQLSCVYGKPHKSDPYPKRRTDHKF